MLQQELPGLRGYSEASIKMMRIFYEEWCILFENRQLAIDDFNNNLANKILDLRKLNFIPNSKLKLVVL